MKILLLGYRGMLGSELFTRLSASHEVWGRGTKELDITSEKACREAISSLGPDMVVNAAAYTNVDACETAGEACFSVNARGVKNIALACRGKAIKILHFSTDYVFDGQKGTPYRENDECRPLNTYGLSKLEGERLLTTISDNYLIIRTAWLYGKYGRNFVNTILSKARAGETLEVVTDQVGSPTYAGDLAAAAVQLIEEGQRGIFHVTNSGYCSWLEFAREILLSAGVNDVIVLPITSDKLTRPAKRPAYSIFDCGKFITATGQDMRAWDDALRDYISGIAWSK